MKEKSYYVFDSNSEPRRWIDSTSVPFIKGVRWMRGARIDVPVPAPLRIKLKPLNPDASDHGPRIAEYMASNMPVFSDALIDALKQAGVDNLELFDLVITDPDNGREYTGYKAVNIVGCIKAADLEKSEYTQHGNGAVIDVDFDKLVIDEKKPRGTLMFRLAESVNVIMVHRSVRDHLQKLNFPFLRFYEPGEIAT